MQSRYVVFLLFLFWQQSIFSQKIVVRADPGSATLALNSETDSKSVKMKPDSEDGVVAFMPGYAAQGITAAELANTGKSDYTIKLPKIKKPDQGFESRKIEFTKLIDKSDKLLPQLTAGLALLVSVDLSQPQFAGAIKTSMSNAGYKMSNNIFNGKSDIPELLLGAEVIWARKNASYFRQKISMVIHWSLYSPSMEKVIFETTTAGYADSIRNGDYDATSLTVINRALEGIIYNKDFQEIVSKKVEPKNVGLKEAITLVKSTSKKFDSYSDIIKESTGSVVTIKTNFGYGSGFIISDNGYILTNHHVVNSVEKIEVVFDNGYSFEAKLVRSDQDRDVALVKMSGSGFKPLPLNATADLATTGTEVIAIGTPENIKLGQTVTKGIISGKRELDEKVFLQTDVAINSGNSGGPLINTSTGEVIGIVAAKIKAKGVEGLGFAIPISDAIKALNLKFDKL